MLNAFGEYLKSSGVAKEKSIPYYCRWVGNAYSHCRVDFARPLTPSQKSDFLQHMAKAHEEWQVKQAQLALRLFTYFLTTLPETTGPVVAPRVDSPNWLAVESKLRERLRLKQRAYSTEKTYLGWLRAFRAFCAGKPPEELAAADIQAFLSHLAVNRQVAAATQNQALNALVFLFRHVLEIAIGNDLDAVRAVSKRRLPVVMTPGEVQAVLNRLTGAHRLMAQLIYGGGLRLAECLNLRIKDLDFEQSLLSVRGKGDKDRRTVLPESLQPELTAHIAGIRPLHEADRADDLPGVALGGALERKYPNAGKEWRWFWLFPAAELSIDPRSRMVRRHHVHPSALQRAFKSAVTAAEITRRASVHTLRHSFATHLLEKGHDIRTIQELLGHNDVRTTMIYTHVAKKNILGVLSPLDGLT